MSQYPNRPGGTPPPPPPHYPPHYPPPYPVPTQQPGSGLATASMVLGIISLIAALGFFWIPVAPQIMAITGLVMGIVAKNQGNRGGSATAGIVLSIIALAWGLIWFISCTACVACFTPWWSIPWYLW